MHQFKKDDIIKVSNEDETHLGKVVEVTEESVSMFRDTGDVWFSFDEWDVEFLGVAS